MGSQAPPAVPVRQRFRVSCLSGYCLPAGQGQVCWQLLPGASAARRQGVGWQPAVQQPEYEVVPVLAADVLLSHHGHDDATILRQGQPP